MLDAYVVNEFKKAEKEGKKIMMQKYLHDEVYSKAQEISAERAIAKAQIKVRDCDGEVYCPYIFNIV